MWLRFDREWLQSPVKFRCPIRRKTEKLISPWLGNRVRTCGWEWLKTFYNSYNLLSKIRVHYWHTTIKSENRCSLNRLQSKQSRKLLRIISYKPNLFSLLINSRLFAADNRFSIAWEAIVIIF